MIGLLAITLAAEPDRAWTGVGMQGVRNLSQGRVVREIDYLFTQRTRWTFVDQDPLAVQARVDVRFTVDPYRGTKIETGRVRELGVHVTTPNLAIDVGRSPVAYGGPRLVDGLQLHAGVGEAWTVGLWAGASPDVYTTRFETRYGGGPILVYTRGQHQASLVGEALVSDVGFDRAGGLLQTRHSIDRRLFIDTRVDLQAVQQGTPIADAAIFARYRVSPSLELAGFYDAHSTWRYLSTQDRDPALQRFDKRSQQLGLTDDVPVDEPDPTLFQLVGASARWATAGPLSLRFDARYRHHALADRRYARVGPVVGWQLSDSLLLTGDVLVLYTDEALRYEAGVTAWKTPDGPLAVDGTARFLYSTHGPGFYVDGFVNYVVPERGLSVAAGAYVHGYETHGFTDTAVGGLARLTWRVRGD